MVSRYHEAAESESIDELSIAYIPRISVSYYHVAYSDKEVLCYGPPKVILLSSEYVLL
jgi:hypothetical protein